jgi:hypothetical protein
VRRAPATIALLLASALVGCGAFDDDAVTERVQQIGLVTKRQVERHPPGSPARAFYEWWRAIQYENAGVAIKYYAPSVGMTLRKLDRQLSYGNGALGLTARPLLVEVDEQGDTATVLTLLESVVENPNGRADKVRRPRGFNLVRDGGEWKLADNLFLDRQARIYLGFSAPLREQQQQQQEQQQGQSP